MGKKSGYRLPGKLGSAETVLASNLRIQTVFVGLLVFVVTVAAVLFALNFTAIEKKVEHQLPRLYSSDSFQVQRAMGSLLGPGIMGNNNVTELLTEEQRSGPCCRLSLAPNAALPSKARFTGRAT